MGGADVERLHAALLVWQRGPLGLEGRLALRNEPTSRVTFTLEPFGSLVKLTVAHDGLVEGGKYLGAISNGWPAILSGLKSLLETGKLLPIPREALGKQEWKR